MRNIDFWASTHQGLQRTNNEDAYLWLTPEDTQDQGYLWVVCDGMGGEAAGERASAEVLARIQEVYVPTLLTTHSPHEALKETLHAANRRLLYLSKEDPALAGMGSTVAAVAFYRDRLWVATVGDSRVYGWTPNGLMQWTVDHSKYEKLREHGVLRPEDERPDHPARHVLMNVMGRESMIVDTLDDRHFVADDCALLICTDGLSGNVNPKELRVAFASLNAKDATRFLLSAALQRSSDNITLQVVRFVPPATPRTLEDVAESFGVTLIDVHREPNWMESGRADAASSDASSRAEAPQQAEERSKPTTQQVELPQRKGETILISPDALSNVFGDTSSTDEDAEEMVQRRLSSQGGTVLLSPDAISKAMASQPSKPPGQDTPAASRPSTRNAAVSSAAIETLDPPRQTQLPLPADPRAAAPPKADVMLQTDDGQFAQGIDDAPPDERKVFIWMLLCVMAAGLAMVAWWWFHDKPIVHEDAAPDEEQVQSEDADGAASPPAELGAFVAAEVIQAPDRTHAVDAMPAYLVADGTLWIDAHEVTETQFAHVRAGLERLGADAEDLKTWPCLGDPSSEDDASLRPACVTPQSAALYCDAVGRRLPSQQEWEEIASAHAPQIARGYGRIFETSEDGIPPAYPNDQHAIVGVYDGLPEVLAQNEAQRRYGDLVLLAPTDDQLVRIDAGAADTYQTDDLRVHRMIGVRCIVDATSLDEERTTPAPEQTQRAPRAASTTPKTAAETPQEARSPERNTGLAPRVDAPDEAPTDPNIPDRSRILDYMKEQQQR